MISNSFTAHLAGLLKTDPRLLDEEKDIQINILRNHVNSLDGDLIMLMLNDDIVREKFFVKVKDVYVFKQNEFLFYLDSTALAGSYTQYANRIGLASGGKFLAENTDYVLDFPYKDCVLEGGQSSEEGEDIYFKYDKSKANYLEKKTKRKEILYNTIIAKDEIDRLLEPKAFQRVIKYDSQGQSIPSKFTRDAAINERRGLPLDTITDNLFIRGNNLLALYSLKEEFKGKVKLVYIDPPYNTGNDDFKYNDNFNHSTWLTFVRNRLCIAKELIKSDGCIFVHIDHHEVGYLNLLMDEVFGKTNKVQLISVRTASPAGFKTVNPGPIDVTEYIFFYTKNKSEFKFRKGYVPVGYNKNYNLVVERSEDVQNWKFYPIKDKVLENVGLKSEKEGRAKFGDAWKAMFPALIEDYAFKNAENVVSVRDPHNPTETVKELMVKSKEFPYPLEHKRTDGTSIYLYKGGSLAFYSSKIKTLDGKPQVTELLTDFWSHISWAGIAKEGGIKLKNGKKPEKLLKQIFDLVCTADDIILDYHLGSGTTAAVAHKMGFQYIGVEQLDYKMNDPVVRLENVIHGDTTGVSKAVKWSGGGSFISIELAKNNQAAKGLIEKCRSLKELIELFDDLSARYFLHYNVKLKEFTEVVVNEEEFRNLKLKQQKELFVRMLDNNQLYVNLSEVEDGRYPLAEDAVRLTKDFYNDKF